MSACKFFDPGPLRQRVTLQTATEAPSPTGSGQLVPTWSNVGDFWARVDTLDGRELFYARQVIAKASSKVTMRQVATITAKDRLIYDGRTLNISSVVKVDNRNEWYQLICTEQTTP